MDITNKTECDCLNNNICCYCKKKLLTKEMIPRKDPYPIKNKDERNHLLCDPCKDV